MLKKGPLGILIETECYAWSFKSLSVVVQSCINNDVPFKLVNE